MGKTPHLRNRFTLPAHFAHLAMITTADAAVSRLLYALFALIAGT